MTEDANTSPEQKAQAARTKIIWRGRWRAYVNVRYFERWHGSLALASKISAILTAVTSSATLVAFLQTSVPRSLAGLAIVAAGFSVLTASLNLSGACDHASKIKTKWRVCKQRWDNAWERRELITDAEVAELQVKDAAIFEDEKDHTTIRWLLHWAQDDACDELGILRKKAALAAATASTQAKEPQIAHPASKEAVPDPDYTPPPTRIVGVEPDAGATDSEDEAEHDEAKGATQR